MVFGSTAGGRSAGRRGLDRATVAMQSPIDDAGPVDRLVRSVNLVPLQAAPAGQAGGGQDERNGERRGSGLRFAPMAGWRTIM